MSMSEGDNFGDHVQVLMIWNEYSEYFAKLLAQKLKSQFQIEVAPLKLIKKTPKAGETMLKFKDFDGVHLFGKDIIYVSSLVGDAEFMEMFRVASALSSYGTRSRIFVIPFLGYSTMERAVIPGEVVTCKTNIRLLSSLPSFGFGNAFLFLDLHVSGILHYFEGSMLRVELSGLQPFIKALKQYNIDKFSDYFMFASADLGRPKWIEAFSKKFHTDIAFIRKTRDGTKTQVQEVIGTVRNKHVIIYDDMTRSGGTLVKAADAYIQNGALSVTAVLSHLALNNDGVIDLLMNSRIDHIIATNSHPFTALPHFQKYISPMPASFFPGNPGNPSASAVDGIVTTTTVISVPSAHSSSIFAPTAPSTTSPLPPPPPPHASSDPSSSDSSPSAPNSFPSSSSAPASSTDTSSSSSSAASASGSSSSASPIIPKFHILDITSEFAGAVAQILRPNLLTRASTPGATPTPGLSPFGSSAHLGNLGSPAAQHYNFHSLYQPDSLYGGNLAVGGDVIAAFSGLGVGGGGGGNHVGSPGAGFLSSGPADSLAPKVDG